MAIIARDNSVYASLDQPLGFGQHRGVAVGLVIDEFPDYIRWLIEHDAIVLAGEVAEAYGLAIAKFEDKEPESDIYDPAYDPFSDTFIDPYPGSDESLADYLD